MELKCLSLPYTLYRIPCIIYTTLYSVQYSIDQLVIKLPTIYFF